MSQRGYWENVDTCSAGLEWVWQSCVHVQVQTEVLQKRQREKAHMMSAIKKYQKGEYILS